MLTKRKSLYIIDIQKKQKRRKKDEKNNQWKPWGCKRERERERESYTLVNKSSLLSLAKTVTLCLLENINMNKKTEIEPS